MPFQRLTSGNKTGVLLVMEGVEAVMVVVKMENKANRGQSVSVVLHLPSVL
jgi:hypothetical protein